MFVQAWQYKLLEAGIILLAWLVAYIILKIIQARTGKDYLKEERDKEDKR